MADGRGGYQRPQKPAPASGPGKLSQRTDGGQPTRTLTDAAYGEQASFREAQQGAPMASGVSAPSQAPAPQADLSNVVPFGEPTQRPMEPVTSGAASGAGSGMEALGMANPDNDPAITYLRDQLPTFELAANLPSANQAFRQFVRRLRGTS